MRYLARRLRMSRRRQRAWHVAGAQNGCHQNVGLVNARPLRATHLQHNIACTRTREITLGATSAASLVIEAAQMALASRGINRGVSVNIRMRRVALKPACNQASRQLNGKQSASSVAVRHPAGVALMAAPRRLGSGAGALRGSTPSAPSLAAWLLAGCGSYLSKHRTLFHAAPSRRHSYAASAAETSITALETWRIVHRRAHRLSRIAPLWLHMAVM